MYRIIRALVCFGVILVLANLPASGALPTSEPISGFGFTNAFPGILFDEPVGIVTPSGETNRIFVLERKGRILLIDDLAEPKVTTFLDLSANTYSLGVEAGLLGLAFHPDFPTNGRFFVYRTLHRNGFRNELSEYRLDPADQNRGNPASEKVLISQLDGQDTHNAGDLKFGPDGYLYLSLGDELPVFEDTHEEPQAIDKGFFAGIIRIDVDDRSGNLPPNSHRSSVGNYTVPKDNPFIGRTQFLGKTIDPDRIRTEFFAIGLRNPWRFTFDPLSGDMIVADVGAGSFEEINIIQRGGNFGWPYKEGLHKWREDAPVSLIPPFYTYPRGQGMFEGRVVIGGVISENPSLRELQGRYLFADFDSGHVWSMDTRFRDNVAHWVTGRRGIAAFAIDPRDGGVLTANFLTGLIEKLIYRHPENSGVPIRLSELNVFQDLKTLTPISSLLPYSIINPLWSDGAAKQRWVNLSGASEKIIFAATEPWEFPTGAYWVKHFELELTNGMPSSRRRLETRLLVQTTNGVYGLSYRWGESNTDAYLLPSYPTNEAFVIHDGGTIRTQIWTYPGWDQCKTCHKSTSGGALSFNTYQLNRSITNGASITNQLSWLVEHDFFENPQQIKPADLPNLVSPDDPTAPFQHKARSYFFSNCSQCHRPGVPNFGPRWDARISTPLEEAEIVEANSFFFPPPMKIIAPGEHTNSFILYRAGNRYPNLQMPPLATSVPDHSFLSTVTNWVMKMPDKTWTSANIGASLAEGAAERLPQGFKLYSAAKGLDDNSIFFSYRPAQGTTELIASVSEFRGASPAAEAGLMLREGLAPDGRYAALFVKKGLLRFQIRPVLDKAAETIISVPFASSAWLKLVTDGVYVSAWTSENGSQWQSLGNAKVELGSSCNAGIFAASVAPSVSFASAHFRFISQKSIELTVPLQSPIELPRDIPLKAGTSFLTDTPATVSFFANDKLISTASTAPFTSVWTTASRGKVRLNAVLNAAGGAITSAPVFLDLAAPASAIWEAPSDSTTGGNWRSQYGTTALLIPGLNTNNTSNVSIRVKKGEQPRVERGAPPSALDFNGWRLFSLLKGNPTIDLSLEANDHIPRSAAIYFHDWLQLGKTQTVTFYNEDGGLLDTATITAVDGVYLRFAFRGRITIHIENPGGTAHFSAVFVDSLGPISVNILSPTNHFTLQQPGAATLEASASAVGRQINRVEFRDQSRLLARLTSPPYITNISNLYFGERTVTAVASDDYGLVSTSAPVRINVLPPQRSVQFLGADTKTQGRWKERYGATGHWIIGDRISVPENFSIGTFNESFYLFADSTADPRALERSLDGGRIAACLFGSPSFSFQVDVLDGTSTIAGFYFLDWENTGRIIDVQVEDLMENVLDRRRVEQFGGGTYLFWRVQTGARFKFSSASINPVISAFLLDNKISGYDFWRNSTFTPEEFDSFQGYFDTGDFDKDGLNNLMEYTLGFDPRDPSDKAEITLTFDKSSFSLRVPHRLIRSDLQPLFEMSTDLITWVPYPGAKTDAGGTSANELTFQAATSEVQMFFRLGVRRTK